MTDHNPLAAIEELATTLEQMDDGAIVRFKSGIEVPFADIPHGFRAALAEAREALGEVTVTEEWTCVVDDCDICGPPLRRTVVATRRVGEWEVAQ